MEKTNIAIRTDSSLEIGLGHVMRCLALAQELHENAANILFICRDLPGSSIDIIKAAKFPVAVLPFEQKPLEHKKNLSLHEKWLGESWDQDAQQTFEALNVKSRHWDWLIVDHYGLDGRWERRLRPYVSKILVIDDLADRRHDCDLLLDQNDVAQNQKKYAALVSPGCRFLFGPNYALLRSEFRRQRKKHEAKSFKPKRIFVMFGGTDPRNITKLVLNILIQLKPCDLIVDVVVGRTNPARFEIEELCASDNNINFYCQPENVAEILSFADFAIGASGTNSWERCCLGIPSAIIAFADNQLPIARSLHETGAAIYLGHYETLKVEDIESSLNRIIAENTMDLKQMSNISNQLVDGYGCIRVCKKMGVIRYKISIVSDQTSWINPYITILIEKLERDGHNVNWVHETEFIEVGHFAFFLSFFNIADDEALAKNEHNLVVHESDLPLGKGWSPLTWQILEGKNQIPIVLFEAAGDVDSGPIYSKDRLQFKGNELVDELRYIQAQKTCQMCLDFVVNFPDILKQGEKQQGLSTYYKRRSPIDSKLDVDKTIREQINLLRTVDNERYPAYFELDGVKYTIKISKG